MKFFSIIILLYTFSHPIFAQIPYSPNDTTALLSIKKRCDNVDSLNWDIATPVWGWSGVYWEDSFNPRRVRSLSFNLYPDGILSDTLDVRALNLISTISCGNNLVEKLLVDNLNQLNTIDCSKNKISSLNVSTLNQLNKLTCYENEMTNLKVDSLANLSHLDCFRNKLQSLNLSGDSSLVSLDCSYNEIKDIDLSNNSKLRLLNCSRNKLDTLNLVDLDSLNNLNISNNNFISLDVESLAKLKILNCERNKLKTLKAKNLLNLEVLICSNNELRSLDLSGNQNLVGLNCSYNQLDSLNLVALKPLKAINCQNNNLSSLVIQNLDSLNDLNCRFNNLKTLNIQGLANLDTLDCSSNNFTFSTLDDIFSIKSLANWGHIVYAPQKKLFKDLVLVVGDSVDYNQESDVNGAATVFKWFKNGSEAKPEDVSQSNGIFSFNNYGTYYCRLTNSEMPDLTLTTKSITVNQKPSIISSWPDLSTLEYLDTLKNSVFSNYITKPDGHFVFGEPNKIMISLGINTVSVTFIPSDSNYLTGFHDLILNVVKATPLVSVLPQVSSITYGDSLSKARFSGGISSVLGTYKAHNLDTILSAGTHQIDVDFTPNDTSNYNIFSFQLNLNVMKKEPYITKYPTILPIEYKMNLSTAIQKDAEVSVAGSFKFKEDTQKLKPGDYIRDLLFIPKDTANYNTLSTSESLVIKKLSQTVNWSVNPPSELTEGDVYQIQGSASLDKGLELLVTPKGHLKIEGLKITCLNAGKVTIQLVQKGNDYYNPGISNKHELTIKPDVLSSVGKIQNLRLFPNPVRNFLTIEGLGLGGLIKIYDLEGKLVLEQKVSTYSQKIDVRDLKASSYLLKVGKSVFRFNVH